MGFLSSGELTQKRSLTYDVTPLQVLDLPLHLSYLFKVFIRNIKPFYKIDIKNFTLPSYEIPESGDKISFWVFKTAF